MRRPGGSTCNRPVRVRRRWSRRPRRHAASTSSPRAPYQKVLTAAIAELQRYWADEYPDLYGDRYQPIPRAAHHRGTARRQDPRVPGSPHAVRRRPRQRVLLPAEQLHRLRRRHADAASRRDVRHVLGRARARARVGPRDPGPCRERRRADRLPGTTGRLLRRRVPLPRRRGRHRAHAEAGRSRSVARGDAPAPRRARSVGGRPVGARQRVRPHRRVPGRLRVGRRAVRDLLRDSAGPRGGALHERGGGAERGTRPPPRT